MWSNLESPPNSHGFSKNELKGEIKEQKKNLDKMNWERRDKSSEKKQIQGKYWSTLF